MSEWKKVRVTIHMGDSAVDAIGVFDAFTKGDSWNGWITPYFTEEQGKRVVAWTRATKERYPELEVETVSWDEDRQAFIMKDPQYPHPPGEPIPAEDLVDGFRVEELGLVLFGIGAYKWTWQEVEDDRTDDCVTQSAIRASIPA